MPEVAAILLAGGSGSRVQRDVNKVYLPVGDRDMLRYSLETLERSKRVGRVVVVVRMEDRVAATRLVSTVGMSKPTHLVAGGPTRQGSEHRGLEFLADDIGAGAVSVVAIHDGARPFMTIDLLDRVLSAADEWGGAVPVLDVDEPLIDVGVSPAHLLDPADLRKAQTPQAFRAEQLLGAFRAADLAGFEGVDTAETVAEFSDLAVAAVVGDPRNIKVTFVEDLFEAEDLAPDFHDGEWRRRR